MISFDEVNTMLEDIALQLPPDIYKELNGGISLLPDAKMHPENKAGDLFIMGEYCHNNLGRYINIFYGSIMQVYPYLPPSQLKEKLSGILKHEFIHHLESLAGEKELILKDAMEIEKYKRSFQ